MKNLITFLVVSITINFYSQGDLRLTNAQVNVSANAQVNVLGNIQYDNGTNSQNNGVIALTDNWINNSGSTALNNASTGKVILAGADQDITGANTTEFYNLEFKTANANKTTLVNTVVKDSLILGDAVLQTDMYLTHLTNPNNGVLNWSNGYVESDKLEGYFLRSTNTTNVYSFPVGNYNLTDVYRAVEVTPTSADSSVFGVRLGVNNPTFISGVSRAGSVAPFDVESKESRLGDLNTRFYHNINRFYGTANASAQVFFFDNDQQGGLFSTMAKWNSIDNQWLDDYFSIQNSPIGKPEFNNPNKVAKSNSIVSYSDDVYTLNDLKVILTTTFTPNNDGINDYFEILGLEFYPNNKLEVYNRWGELVYSASPYLNNWNGINTSNGVKLQSNVVQEDTYFYVLTLDENQPPLKNYIEIIRD
jgi:gliding motility-associated-like protein